MEFHLLGPFEVTVAQQQVHVGGPRAQLVLAGLLLQLGRTVAVTDLVELVWGEDPPATARKQVQMTMHQLRQLLHRHSGGAVRTHSSGYRLEIEPRQLDLDRFARAVAVARRHVQESDLHRAAAEYRSALRLWRGDPLVGLSGNLIVRHAIRLDELRLTAVEEYAEVELQLGRHRDLIPELTKHAAAHPLRERIAGVLMTALHREGRQADAMRIYRDSVARLRDELGVEPGPELRDRYVDLLRGEATAAAGPAPDAARPRCLPATVPRLIGRDRESAELLRASANRILVIDGMAGVGKSSLALSAALALGDRFPDAHLFVDLHGHSQQAPMSHFDSLGILLGQLQLPAGQIPAELPGRIALWRSRLAQLRGIVVLDNAADAAQLEPLLSGDTTSLIIVTSRVRLAPIDGAWSISLQPLDVDSAIKLLLQTADEPADPSAQALEVAQLCGRLPLTLRLIGHRLRHRPQWTLAELADRLRTADPAPIAVAVQGRSTAAAFMVSYQQLTGAQQRLFRLLGLHPPEEFEAWAAAALGTCTVEQARDLLDELVDMHLVQATAPGRFRLHDLLREFAASLVGQAERGPALTRMLDYYQDSLAAAGAHFRKPYQDLKPAVRQVYGRTFTTIPDQVSWVKATWSTIVTLVDLAGQAGAYGHAAALAEAMYFYTFVLGRGDDGLHLAGRALAAADATGDDGLAAFTNRMVAGSYLQKGQHAECRLRLERAAAVYRRLGDEMSLTAVSLNSSTLLRHEGRLTEALQAAEAAALTARALGVHGYESRCLFEAGVTARSLGRYRLALDLLRQAVSLQRSGSQSVLGLSLGELGCVHLALGQLPVAAVCLTWSISIKQQHGNAGGAAEALSTYGRVLARQGYLQDALSFQRRAYEQVEDEYEGYFEPTIGNDLGETLTLLGRFDEAVAAHERALRRAEQINRPYEQARAYAGVAAARRSSASGAEFEARAVAAFEAMGLTPQDARAVVRPQQCS